MISKNKIKILKSLNTKKGRLSCQAILIEGKRLIEEVLFEENKIIQIWSTKKFKEQNPSFIEKLKIKNFDFQIISNQEIKIVTNTINPQGIIATSKISKGTLKNIKGNVIILDNISDPGNLGTIMRSAAWFGINNIFLSYECVDPYNPKVIRSAMGSHFRQNIVIDEEYQVHFEITGGPLGVTLDDIGLQEITKISDFGTSSVTIVSGTAPGSVQLTVKLFNLNDYISDLLDPLDIKWCKEYKDEHKKNVGSLTDICVCSIRLRVKRRKINSLEIPQSLFSKLKFRDKILELLE